MKKYHAIQEIGDYKKGDEVPADKAEIWIKMYLKSPVKVSEVPDEPILVLDLNKDGKVDKDDSKIASKVMNKIKSEVKNVYKKRK